MPSASETFNNHSYSDCEYSSLDPLFIDKKVAPVTVIVPAYNEESVIDQTLSSLEQQTSSPASIIVVDDFSSDRTGEIAKSFDGVEVIRPSKNTGSKAGAQTFALPFVNTKYTIAIDADTSLTDDAIEKMCKFMDDYPGTAAASSYVIPKNIKTVWERGRFIEYMFVFPFTKRIQEWYGKPLISSGCFSIYDTKELKSQGGWSSRTMAEDMDLTWSLYENGKIVRYNHEVYCFPFEPNNLDMMKKQLKRWSHGYIQNVKLHWVKIKKIPILREQIIASFTDSLLGTFVLVVVVPITSIITHDFLTVLYIILVDLLFISIPAIIKGIKIKKLRKVLSSLPSFFVLRFVNMYFFYKALVFELLLKKSLKNYEKGH